MKIITAVFCFFLILCSAHAEYISDYPSGCSDAIFQIHAYLSENKPETGFSYCEKDIRLNIQSVDPLQSNQQNFSDYSGMESFSWRAVAVIDTGVDFSHEDLSGKGDTDLNGHGTAVAGIIGAIRENSYGIRGITAAELLSYQAIDASGSGSVFSVSRAICDAADRGADIIGIFSGCSEYSKTLENAVKYAREKGCVIIAPAGNTASETVLYPAKFEQVISVGAVNRHWQPCDENDWGTDGQKKGSSFGKIDVWAPGSIYTTLLGNTYGIVSGTSYSAAIVAGIAANLSEEILCSDYQTIIQELNRIIQRTENENLSVLSSDIQRISVKASSSEHLNIQVKNINKMGFELFWNSKKESIVFINRIQYAKTSENRLSVSGLKPGTSYTVNVRSGSEEEEVMVITKDSAGINWYKSPHDAQFSKRRGHTSVVFNDELFVIGGYDGSNYLNDVWSSADGINWTKRTAHAEFAPRAFHSAVVYDDKILVIAGENAYKFNDVWYSKDGIHWGILTDSAEFSPRAGQSAAIFNNRIYVIGGAAYNGLLGDVWVSESGSDWCLAASGRFAPRSYHSLEVFDKKLWIISGNMNNEILYSADGVQWEKVRADFSPRSAHSSAVFNGKLWVAGGFSGKHQNDIWCSADGVSWTHIGDFPFEGRNIFSMVNFSEKLFVIGGFDGKTSLSDVWWSF